MLPINIATAGREHVSIPAFLGQPSTSNRRDEKSQQVTPSRAHHIGQANAFFRGSCEYGQPQSTLGEIKYKRGPRQLGPERHPDDQYSERLKREWYGEKGDLDLGSQSQQQGAGDRQDNASYGRIGRGRHNNIDQGGIGYRSARH